MRRLLPFIACTVFILGASAARAEKLVLVAGGADPDAKKATEAKLGMPFGVDFDRSGNLYFVEMTGHRLRKIDREGNISTIAGTGEKGGGGDGGPALHAKFNSMHSLAVAANGDIYLADTWNNRVRKVDAKTGMISAFAGTGEKGFSGDGGPAAQAKMGGVYCVALDPQGEKLYLADLDNRRIRFVDLKTGITDTIAGNGKKGIPRDGDDAKSAPLVDPRACAADSDGNVYILERSGDALRVVDRSGKIRTLIAKNSKSTLPLNGPKHLCVDRQGNVSIADTENHRILKYQPGDQTVTQVAGTGKRGAAGLGGPPLDAKLNQPHGVFIGPKGDLYIADSSNNRILKIER